MQFLPGDIYLVNGEPYVVTSATPAITPYHRAGQDTRSVGQTLGLRRDEQFKDSVLWRKIEDYLKEDGR